MRGRYPAADDYRRDSLYPDLAHAVDQILRRGNVVAPVDVLIGMRLLTREHFEAWRHGQVPYLEQVISANLSQLVRLLRILRSLAHDLSLKPSLTPYTRWGEGPTEQLRFTQTGEGSREEAYATHFVWPGKGMPLTCPRPLDDRGGDPQRSDSDAARKAS